jgi:NAD-dependent DNA ligase
LTRIISRAIGPASRRYVDARAMLADLDERARRPRMQSLDRKRVCITGILAKATRSEARSELEKRGAIYQTEVGPGTDVLVRGRPPPLYRLGRWGTKLAAAEVYGTKVIGESQFWRLLRQ